MRNKKVQFCRRQDRLYVFIGLFIIIAFYGTFFIWQLIQGIRGSFYDWNPIMDTFKFIGFENYIRIGRDPDVLQAFLNTFIFAIVVLLGRTFFGLTIALGINSVRRFRTFLRSAYFIPVITSMTGASLIIEWIFEPYNGILNQILTLVGIDTASLLWFKSSRTALLSVMLMFLWKTLGIPVVVYLAGLSSIPSSYIEASRMDGANPFGVFRYVRWPLLIPATIFTMVTTSIIAFQVFIPMFVITFGGPNQATTSIVLIIYEAAFAEYRFGYASALAQILFVIILVFSLVQYNFLRKVGRT